MTPGVPPNHRMMPVVLPNHRLTPRVSTNHRLTPRVLKNHRLMPESHRTTTSCLNFQIHRATKRLQSIFHKEKLQVVFFERSNFIFYAKPAALHRRNGKGFGLNDVVNVICPLSCVTKYTARYRWVPNVPLVYKLLSCWDSKKQCFLIKDQKLLFTVDEVAMILGLPNRGNNFEIGSARITGKSANDIKKEVISLDESTAMPDVLKKFIIFLLSNLFFPLHNYRTPASIISVARNVEKFLSYNWPDSIREFLVTDFNAIAKKMKRGQPLGYLNGFVHIIIIWFLEHYTLHEPLNSKSRPRFLCWGSDVVYNDADASSLFDGLEVGHLLTSFDAITTEERALLANPPPRTPQTSPDKVPNKEIILHTPHEHLSTPPTPPTPKSPLRQNTPPPSSVRPPPSPISPGGPSTETPHVSHSQQQQQQHTPPPEGQQDYRGEYIQKVLDQNRFLKGRLITLETTMSLNERRMEAVEHYVFEQREMNKRMKAMEKFLSENFPSFNSSTVAVHVQSSSRTMSDEMKKAECAEVIAECMFEDTQPLKDVLAKPEPSSSGIAKRVRGRVDRKAKEVKTPYTKGQYKRKVLKKAVIRPFPAKVELTNALIEVESQRSPGPRPAPTKLDYPGRQMISDDMRMFIDACLKKYTDMSDTIYTAGNIQIFRSQIDELLTNQYLDDNHIDAFTSLLAEKNKLRPGLYQPFIYVSSLHWASKKYDMESKQYVSHINKDAVTASNFLLLPVNDDKHWTLLVAYLKKATWYFFDSLPNPLHRAVLPLVINHLQEETQGCFQTDIRTWKILEAEGVPTQTNGYDCGMVGLTGWSTKKPLIGEAFRFRLSRPDPTGTDPARAGSRRGIANQDLALD
ncbi:hypothetical protein KFK09_021641 [Dendrobium nobile]|uniref:Ubiquitin-like protease family profile domain-containing protein n=1 Tax=Dendrobium nobile TaxID=94219 RepID=A0A8T3AQJ6_DENNO|nr:hypothetical protein KFK09_021641 [Dendrobium nobile]